MSKSSTKILRLRRSDPSEGLPDFALVQVSAASGARNPLDVKLLATEGESAFVATIKHDKITSLKDKRNTGSDAQWEAILSRTLLFASASDELDAGVLEGLEAVYSVPDNNLLTITWRRTKRKSKQVLGSISLAQSDDEQIDPFLWAGEALEASDKLSKQAETLQKQLTEEQQTTQKLKDQLASIVAAKEEHEHAIFSKFVELLNAKKLKIRDQQRLLAGARLDSNADRVTSSTGRADTSEPASKRAKTDDSGSAESDDSDAFEDVSMKAATESPIQSDIDSGMEEDPAPPPPPPTVRRMIGGSKGKQPASITSKQLPKNSDIQTNRKSDKSSPSTVHKADRGGGGVSDDEAASGFDNQPPPKRRELPFQRKNSPLPAPQQASTTDDLTTQEKEAESTPAVTRSQAQSHEAPDAMDEDSDTEEEL